MLVGLAFNTKTLGAWLVVPGIALAYAVCAPLALVRRLARLAVAGVLMAAVCFCWIAAVELTPASKRPYVGGSTDNSELGLAFEYNGFGRVEGQVGGPGRAPFKPGAFVHAQRTRPPQHSSTERGGAHGGAQGSSRSASPSATQAAESANKPIPFGGPAGPLRR